MSPANKNKTAPAATPGPGALLREKRLEKEWSVADVANALCLSGYQLTALENDDYKNLPGETYVQGYRRNYARLLGISPAELADENESRIRAHTLETQSASDNGEPQRHYLAIIFALLLIVFLSGIWFWQHEPSPAVGDGDGNGDDVNLSTANTDPTPETIARPEANFSAQHDSQSSPDSVPADAILIPPVREALDTIAFRVRDESWLEVQDDAGNYLIARRVTGGEQLQLAGKSPFTVFIGNAAGVTVQYHGEPVTVSDSKLFARLKVGSPINQKAR